jgi:hypothetical protein
MNMRRTILGLMAGMISLLLAGCGADQPLAPAQVSLARGPSAQACWGQATKVFAQTGEMGEHSSSFAGDPRLGLRNLARALYEQGVIPDDTLQALGAFVAAELGLSISACM